MRRPSDRAETRRARARRTEKGRARAHRTARRVVVVLSACALPALGGCPGFGDQTAAELEGIDFIPTWDAHIRALMLSECATCHGDPPANGATDDFRLDLYAGDETPGALATAARIRVRAVLQQSMPPADPLTAYERALIDAWVRAGAPQR